MLTLRVNSGTARFDPVDYYRGLTPSDDGRPKVLVTNPGQGDRSPSLVSEKIPQARQLDDVVRRQDRVDNVGLQYGVNFVKAALRFG
jgi:hypothetical protein